MNVTLFILTYQNFLSSGWEEFVRKEIKRTRINDSGIISDLLGCVFIDVDTNEHIGIT